MQQIPAAGLREPAFSASRSRQGAAGWATCTTNRQGATNRQGESSYRRRKRICLALWPKARSRARTNTWRRRFECGEFLRARHECNQAAFVDGPHRWGKHVLPRTLSLAFRHVCLLFVCTCRRILTGLPMELISSPLHILALSAKYWVEGTADPSHCYIVHCQYHYDNSAVCSNHIPSAQKFEASYYCIVCTAYEHSQAFVNPPHPFFCA